MKGYDNFFIPVDNLEEAIQFYTVVLGGTIAFDFRAKGMVGIRIGNEEPAIILKDKHLFPDAEPTIWFEVADVLSSYNMLKEKNVVFISDPYEIGTGLAVEFRDQDGNKLGITDYSKRERKI